MSILKKITMDEEKTARREIYMIRETKKRFFKNSIVHLLYASFVLIDHIIWVNLKISPFLQRGEVVICDQYFFDTFVKDITFELKCFRQTTFLLAWVLIRLIPKPQISFLMDIDQNIAFSRKNDVPSVDHLTKLRIVYRSLAAFYGVNVIDGSKDLDSLINEVFESLTKNLPNHKLTAYLPFHDISISDS